MTTNVETDHPHGWHTSHCSLVNTGLTVGNRPRGRSWYSLSAQPDRARQYSGSALRCL